MNTEEILKFTDALVFAKIGKHLSDLQRLLIQTAWSRPGENYDQIAKATGYSASYLRRDAGPKLWLLLSDVFGEKVKKSNFRAAIERQTGLFSQHSSLTATLLATENTAALGGFSLPMRSPLQAPDSLATENRKDRGKITNHFPNYLTNRCQDWGEAPDVSIFCDRSNELAQLEQWIVTDHCRLVGLVGMGGMGKTYLSVKLAERIQEQFDYVIWRSLDHAPSLQQMLTSLLPLISNSCEIDLPRTVNEKLLLLIDYLRKYRCLLVLDNIETILNGGDYIGLYKQGYEDYRDFFKRLGECRHNSCLVFTSREKPKEIALMQGESLPVRCLNLRGLSVSAGIKLLQLKGYCCYSEAECRILIEQYSGNPLALKMAATAIQESFEGSMEEFIQSKTLVCDEIQNLLDQHLNRLSDLEKTVLYNLAVRHEPVSITELHSTIAPPIGQKKLIEIIRSLWQRSLIIRQSNQFSIEPLLMEYVSSLLLSKKS